jgi:NADH-quinone oxidoreductase subunit C
MLLAKIKEALKGLYEEVEEIQAGPETVEAGEKGADAPAAAPAGAAPEAQSEEEIPEKAPGKAEDAAVPEESPVPPGPRETDYQAKGYHLDVALPPEKIVAAVEILNRENFFIEAITGVDWIAEQQLEVVYDFNHFAELCRVVLRSRLDRSNPEIPTISHIYQGANWHERETHDFFGIKFTGHPNLEPLLLPEDADFHPLLKDFKA